MDFDRLIEEAERHTQGQSDAVFPESLDDSRLGRMVDIRSVLNENRHADYEKKATIVSDFTHESFIWYYGSLLTQADVEVLSVVFDVLNLLWQMESKLMRNILILKNVSGSLLDCSIAAFRRSGADEAVAIQITEFFRFILESGPGADTFIADVYESGFAEALVASLTEDSSPSFLQQSILDLFGFCICSHHIISKGYFLRCGSLFKALRVILLRESTASYKIVTLSAIRLVRAFLWQKDPQLLKCLNAFNIPGLIIQLVHLHRPNGFVEGTMIYSATLEVLTFLCVNQQTNVIESLCRPGSESEDLIRALAEDDENKSHSELARYMLSTAEKMTSQYLFSGGEDLTSRHSIGSSRGRSLSPHPLVVPMPSRKRPWMAEDEDQVEPDEELIPKTPGASPDLTPEVKRTRSFSLDEYND